MNKRRFNTASGNFRGNSGGNSGRGFGRGFRKFPQKVMPNAELIAAIAQTNAINHVKQEQPEADYVPVNKFEDFKISPQVLENIKLKGYISPTPIQDQVIASI